jgi:beta-phosphoglucomutase
LEAPALVFDLDGVITDTAAYHYQSWKRVTDEEGLTFTWEDNRKLLGLSRREGLDQLLDITGVTLPDEDTAQEWMRRKNDYFQIYLEELSHDDLLPGVLDFLEEGRSANYKMAVASSSRNAKPVIAKLGLGHYFSVIGDAYTVANAKPAPDLFIWAAGGLRVPVRDVIVFEDAEAGVEAARTAGCASVGIGSTVVAHADLYLPTLEGVHVAEVVEQVMHRRLPGTR